MMQLACLSSYVIPKDVHRKLDTICQLRSHNRIYFMTNSENWSLRIKIWDKKNDVFQDFFHRDLDLTIGQTQKLDYSFF